MTNSMLHQLTTESVLPESERIDSLDSLEIVRLMNREDAKVAEAVGSQAQAIAAAVDEITRRFRLGGRLVYIGAGTSGRLGVLDASECPPTFNTNPSMVVGVIAGGESALTRAIEGAEDRKEQATVDLQKIQFSGKDVLVGIASSGRTPYVIGAIEYAKSLGGATIAVVCNARSEMSALADIAIEAVVGPEVLSGSTRLKSGTATKMILNMLTTGAMIRLGKTYGNLMVDLRATNVKLWARAIRLTMRLTSLEQEQAEALLKNCDGEVKVAVIVAKLSVTPSEARDLLHRNDGHLRKVIG